MNKKLGFILIVFIFIYAVLITYLYIHDAYSSSFVSESYTPMDLNSTNNKLPSDGCIRDAETACKIADAVFRNVYGDNVEKEKPYSVAFYNKSQSWYVHGNLPKNYVGGTANILIQKSDGKVLSVWHSK